MPDLTKPNLDTLYREAGLRNSLTQKDGVRVDFTSGFYSFGDFKREIRALLMVPIIAGTEVLKQTLQAFADLLIAGVQLATLDGRGFNTLGNFFVHLGNAIALTFEGAYDFVGSALSLYFRTLTTVLDTVGKLFENEATDVEEAVEQPASQYTVRGAPFVNPYASVLDQPRFAPSAPAFDAPPAPAGIYPSLATVQQAGYGRYGLFQAAPPAARPSLLQAQADLESIDGLTEGDRTQMFQDMIDSGQYTDDRSYGTHYGTMQ